MISNIFTKYLIIEKYIDEKTPTCVIATQTIWKKLGMRLREHKSPLIKLPTFLPMEYLFIYP
jgi:hypothetical protein